MLKTYYIKTFGCQMNYADSEKIDMILRSAGLRKVLDPVLSDIVISNTCSVRQKWEDRVFGFIHEIERYHKTNATGKTPLFGITGCMVRKSGLAKRYLTPNIGSDSMVSIPLIRGTQGVCSEISETNPPTPLIRGAKKPEYKRKNASMIALLDSSDALTNYDDELFLRSQSIDFVFRIEEVSFLTKILSLITSEDIGNDAKFNEYLAVKQLQENPASANVIIQTGCDNYCSFCIVPYTRGREISRDPDEIVAEIREVVQNGTREVTLLGQNVNSYGKETKKKLWNAEEMKWSIAPLSRGDGDSQGGFVSDRALTSRNHIPYRIDLEEKAKELRKNQTPFEKIFWYEILRQDSFERYKFTRQKPLWDYIVDFYCSELQLVVELDGDQHGENVEYDEKRTQELGEYGIRVVRYPNQEVLKNKEGVYESLMSVIREQELWAKPPGSYLATPLDRGTSEQNPPARTSPPPLTGGQMTPFRDLLDKISQIDGLDRIRFTSSNPHDMTLDILSAHFDLPHMTPHLHFALQSGSDSMLQKMNRKHTYADFKSQVDYLRSRDPRFSISTDIIVGFPGETEEEFQATATAMRECQFDVAFIARYSARTGTTATNRFEDDISPSEKARRWTILNDILRETAQSRNLLMVGRVEEILISWEWKDETWVGRTRNFKEVFIPKEALLLRGDVTEWQGGLKIWDLVKVLITEWDKWVLKGDRV